jgi:outer membrane protein, multidrug efflux system
MKSKIIIIFIALTVSSCTVFKKWDDKIGKKFTPEALKNNQALPSSFGDSKDTISSASISWKAFFEDKNLVNLIDTAINNNYELLSTMQEIQIARNNVQIKHSFILPQTAVGFGMGLEKVGTYTSQGAGDASAEILPGRTVPEILGDFNFGIRSTWELDVWHKLRNAKKSAFTQYLASVEGRNFIITNIVSEIAHSYYELLALDNQLDIINQTIVIQKAALDIMKNEKEAAKVTELAVRKFEAEVLNSQSREFDILQNIKETENRINFLCGRFPQPIVRDISTFQNQLPKQIQAGIPSQLLANRPDIRQAELALSAANINVKIAKAEFYPSFGIRAGLGFQAFNPQYLLSVPHSLTLGLAGDLMAPVINRLAIKAEFNNAKADQLNALYNYQKSILGGFVEISNELSNIDNLGKLYAVKSKEVEIHINAIELAGELFKYARADYFEVLITQRDALDSRLELVETKKRQFSAVIDIYKSLGGGWR